MKHFIASFAMLLALAGFCAAPARADDKADRLAAAKELLVVMHVTDTAKQVLPALLDQMKTLLGAQNPKVGQDLAEIGPRLQAKFFADLDELSGQMAAIYADTFTVAELHDIVAFYKSPTGAKLATKAGQMAKAGMEVGRAWGLKVGESLQADIKSELRKRGYQI
jgi:hypothetical protein